MHTTVALSRGWLAPVHGFRGTVLGVFPRAVYVEPPDGDLVVVHDVAHPHTPTSVLVDVGRVGGWPVEAGDVAAARAGHLRVGGLVVDVRQARLWQPAPPPASGGASTAPVAPALSNGLAAHVDSDQAAEAASLVALLLADGDPRGPVRSLVGRGPGLTPAGDDTLVGILAVLHRNLTAAEAARPLLRLGGSLSPILTRTNRVSAHYLGLALRGHFTEALAAVVDGLADPAGPSLGALRRLLSTGATSGADALAGVVGALETLRSAYRPTTQRKDVA